MANVGALVNLVGSLPLLFLGAYVAWLKPRTRGKTAFGLFMLLFGAAFVESNAFILAGSSTYTDPSYTDLLVRLPILLASVGFLLASVGTFPLRVGTDERGTRVAAFAFGGLLIGSTVLYISLRQANPGATTDLSFLGTFQVLASTLQHGLMGLYAALLGIRFRAAADPVVRRQCALLAAGLATFVAFVAAAGGNYTYDPFSTDGANLGRQLAYGSFLLVTLVSWGLAMRSPEGRIARAVLLWTAFVPAFGAFYAAALDYNGVYGVVRVLSFCILTYAIVKYQLLGIDVKLRLAIKGSTLAAIFIGVFFVVSELAQQFFGARYQNQYIGIAAAGGLVFAMAPLQRLADRVAVKAVPLASQPVAWEVGDATSNELTYGLVLAKFLRDGKVSREEERALARVATRLGVSAERSLALRETAEAGAGASRRRRS